MPTTWINPFVEFNPLDLAPALWLDADDLSTITSSSGNVSQWNDKSGNGYHVSQSSGTAQPKTGTITRNGRNVIDFDGTADYLIRETDTAIGRNVTGVTVYIVARHDSQTDNSTAIATASGTSTASNRFFIYLTGSSPSATMTAQGRTLDSDSPQSVITTAGSLADVWTTQVVIYDYADTALYQYVNGTLDGSNTAFQTATTSSNTDSLRLTIGINHALATVSLMNGQIAEILVYHSAHSATTRTSVYQYFKQKWDV